jgi:hypothetical protein
MDKTRFIDVAPTYYALAVMAYMARNNNAAISHTSLMRDYGNGANNPDEYYCYLEKEELLDAAFQWLAENLIITVTYDDFAPPIYRPSSEFDRRREALLIDENTTFGRYALSPDKNTWLESGLVKVNREFDRLGISAKDFESPDAEWEPIALDRNDESLTKAIGDLDKIIDLVRMDNGYNANAPEEKELVLDSLNSATSALKTKESVSVPYLRQFALEPLARLIKRFGPAAIGVAASLARETLFAWLKNAGVKGLEYLWRSIF